MRKFNLLMFLIVLVVLLLLMAAPGSALALIINPTGVPSMIAITTAGVPVFMLSAGLASNFVETNLLNNGPGNLNRQTHVGTEATITLKCPKSTVAFSSTINRNYRVSLPRALI